MTGCCWSISAAISSFNRHLNLCWPRPSAMSWAVLWSTEMPCYGGCGTIFAGD